MRHLTSRGRAGFTLVEILVAMVAFSLVGLVLVRTLQMSQRVTTAQTNRAQMQSNIRVGSVVVPNELRMLNQSDSTDIVEVTDTSISYLAMRGYYIVCTPTIASATSITVARVTNETYSFDYRAPEALDSAFIFYENDTLKFSDDKWARVGISAVTTGVSCTYPATNAGAGVTAPTGVTLTLGGSGINTGVYSLSRFFQGAPVRVYEYTKMSIMTGSDGNKYLGMCTKSCAGGLQPVVGPLADAGGFKLTGYKDDGSTLALSTGLTYAQRNSLRSLRVKIVGKTEQAISRGTDRAALQTVTDSLITVVTLRNVKQN